MNSVQVTCLWILFGVYCLRAFIKLVQLGGGAEYPRVVDLNPPDDAFSLVVAVAMAVLIWSIL